MARRIRAREVLRLRSVNGLSQNAIARTAHVSKHSVQDVLEAARERGVSWGASRGCPRRPPTRCCSPAGATPGRCTPTPTGHASTASSRGPASRSSSCTRSTPTSARRPAPSMSYDRICKRSITRPPGSTGARPTCGSVAHRPVTIKKHRGQCRPRCPSAISAVPFRDIRQCSSEQILIPLKNSRRLSLDKCRYARLFGFI